MVAKFCRAREITYITMPTQYARKLEWCRDYQNRDSPGWSPVISGKSFAELKGAHDEYVATTPDGRLYNDVTRVQETVDRRAVKRHLINWRDWQIARKRAKKNDDRS